MRIAERASNFLELCRSEGLRETAYRYLDRPVGLVWTSKPVWTPRRLYVRLESVAIDRPVFVLGTQGAGLTLLVRMIRRHPRVVTVGGGPSFWGGRDEMDRDPFGRGALPDGLSLRAPGYRNTTGREEEHPVFGLERSWVYATDALLPVYRKTAEDATGELCRALRRTIASSIRAHATDVPRARFVDKSQTYTLKVPLLQACLRDARFVVQLRDPYVMCWREATRWPEHKYRLWRRKPSLDEGLRLAAQHWRNTYRTALDDLSGREEGLWLRFEDLIARPEDTLRRVMGFIGLRFTSDLLPQPGHSLPLGSKARDKWYPIRSDANERYLREIPTAACVLLRYELGDLAEELGYSVPRC